MTKKQEGFKWQYDKAAGRDIFEVYGRPSYNKVRAFRNCKATQEYYNGYDARIPSASCHFFTFAFKYRDDAGTERMYYDTGRNVYDFALV